MEDKKENESLSGNANGQPAEEGKKTPVSFLKAEEFRAHACSPVREETGEDDEVYTDDLEVLERRLSRDYQKSRQPNDLRRQTLGTPGSGLKRRTSIGGRKPASRRSFGGKASYEVHVMNDLKDELRQREKLDHTRQHRLNAMDIKRREAENKLAALQSKYRELKKEKDDLVRQNIELRKKNKQLTAGKGRLEEQKQQQDRTIRALLAKVGESRGSSCSVRQSRPESANSKSMDRVSDSGNSSMLGDDLDDDESFREGSEVLEFVKSSNHDDPNATRRYTMAPGEIGRLRPGSKLSDSKTIRIENLPKNSMSKDAANLCVDYGMVVHARVTKCVVSGELKGYLTFAEPSSAKEAVRQLRAKGFKAKVIEEAA